MITLSNEAIKFMLIHCSRLRDGSSIEYNKYETGIKVNKESIDQKRIQRHQQLPDLNYRIYHNWGSVS